jgi:hypothetical protein
MVSVATWRDVHRIAMSFPGVSETSSRGHRAWIIDNKFFVWERPLRRSDLNALGNGAPSGPILGVRTDGLEMKEALLQSDPDVYFTTPHFEGYPAVLVQLKHIPVRQLRDIISEAWLARAPKRIAAEYLRQRTGAGQGRL